MINADDLIFWSPGVTLEAIKKAVVLKAFKHFRGNKTATANALGINVRTLDHHLERYAEDEKNETERKERAKREQEEWLRRARGNPGNNVFTGEAPAAQVPETVVSGANAGVGMESVTQAAAQSTVPMPQRHEVQGVPSRQASQGSPRKAR